MSLRSRIPFRPVFSEVEFGHLKMPVLLLIGDREALYDANSAVDHARQLIPHIEAAIITSAGHMLTTDQTEEVMRRAMIFLYSTP